MSVGEGLGAVSGVTAGTAASLAGLNAAIAAGVAHRAEEDRLTVSLSAALPLSALPKALAEVDRRAELFARVRASSPSSGPHPRLAALQSVLDDARMGWLS